MFPGNALLTLDLIIINHFISRLQSDNLLLELSLRDQVLEGSGLRSLLPCLHLVRTVRLNGSQFDNTSVRRLTEVASEVTTLHHGNPGRQYPHVHKRHFITFLAAQGAFLEGK